MKIGTDGVGLMLSFIPGVGWVWGAVSAVDGAAGAGCTFTRITDIKNAAKDAKKWCKCPEKKQK